jgi:glycosyltransferase involved in cell wall biosynthesis
VRATAHEKEGQAAARRPVGRKVILVHNTAQYLHLHYIELVRSLLGRGWIVQCVAPRDAAAELLEAEGAGCIDVTLSRRGINPIQEAGTWGALYRLFRRERPAAVLNFSIKPAIYGSLAARVAGVPMICSMITGLGYVFLGRGFPARILSMVAGWGYRAALSGNHRVFFQNPDDRDFFAKRRIVAHERSVVLNGTGIDTERFAPRPGTRKGATGVGFLMVTRLLADKGVREFVDACAELRSRDGRIRCGLLGPLDDNPSVISRQELEDWVDRRHIDYLGETTDVAAVLADYDVFVLPSYREGLPRATLEAMAMGKPIVTTDVPGCRETVVDGVNGYLVPPRDAVALAGAMKRFLDDPELATTMGRASRDVAVGKYDVHAVNKVILEHLEGADESH